MIVGFFFHKAGYFLILFEVFFAFLIFKLFSRKSAGPVLQWFSFTFHFLCVLVFTYNRSPIGLTPLLGLMISFVKIHMVACNYKDAYVLIKNPDYKKRDDKEPADKDL